MDDFSIVSNRIVRPDCRIFMFESVVRVGVSGDNFFELGISETRCVVFGQELVKPLLAATTNVVAGVALATIEDAEVKTRSVEHPSHALGDFALARIVRGEVPDKPQDVDSLLPGIFDCEAKTLSPFSPVALGFAERIPVASQFFQGGLHVAVDNPLRDQVAAHLDYQRNMFDPHWAGLNAGQTGRARPQGISLDHAAGEDTARLSR